MDGSKLKRLIQSFTYSYTESMLFNILHPKNKCTHTICQNIKSRAQEKKKQRTMHGNKKHIKKTHAIWLVMYRKKEKHRTFIFFLTCRIPVILKNISHTHI